MTLQMSLTYTGDLREGGKGRGEGGGLWGARRGGQTSKGLGRRAARGCAVLSPNRRPDALAAAAAAADQTARAPPRSPT
jgi:hypothetical protein